MHTLAHGTPEQKAMAQDAVDRWWYDGAWVHDAATAHAAKRAARSPAGAGAGVVADG